MPSKKSIINFLKTKEFKLFLTVWIIYAFYIQMYGSSCMSNSNSALTAAIVNEGRFEIDTYYKATCEIALYKGHYYSGMAPGISFISAPLYAVGKGIFGLVPDSSIDSLYGKLENYGTALEADYKGEQKIISNYFPDLNKRQILEYLFISTFILPVFTTALFGAISAVLLYIILRSFTKNEKLRILIALFYALGTLLFPLATEFFQRPIAITLMFAAFTILFKVKHHEIKKCRIAFLVAGLLAGLSVWFDYYHLIPAGLLFFYILTFKARKNRFNLSGLAKYAIGAAIPLMLLLFYHYVVFDNPLTTPYKYKPQIDEGIKFPSRNITFRLFEFFLYSPIIIFALYGLYKAVSKKDDYYPEALGTLIFFIATFVYASLLAIVVVYYPGFLPASHKRYMLPAVPYLMVFLSYALANHATKDKKSRINTAILIVGFISIFFNWTAAQFGGHWALTQFDVDTRQLTVIPQLLGNGPSSSFLHTLSGVLGWNSLILNIAGLIILVLVISLIWKPYLPRKTKKKP
ncbi:DUF3488 domain-containing protein [Candidatus Woesearchaeota archaeon]|nr:DUF3488 domain-containing protein [Candidatus Woesearchaeota archaeon]